MYTGSENQPSALEQLSALVDGEADPSSAACACTAWRDDSSSRAAWHCYQLIGDVLRSDDLAIRHDASLLVGLRARLAQEPVVLAPQPLPDAQAETPVPHRRFWSGRAGRTGSRGSARTWMAPSAVAAGFVLVAGVVMVTRQPSIELSAPIVKATPHIDRTASADAVVPVSFSSQASSASDFTLLRDPRIDRYLAAHQRFAGSTALGVPSGFLRNAVAETPGR